MPAAANAVDRPSRSSPAPESRNDLVARPAADVTRGRSDAQMPLPPLGACRAACAASRLRPCGLDGHTRLVLRSCCGAGHGGAAEPRRPLATVPSRPELACERGRGARTRERAGDQAHFHTHAGGRRRQARTRGLGVVCDIVLGSTGPPRRRWSRRGLQVATGCRLPHCGRQVAAAVAVQHASVMTCVGVFLPARSFASLARARRPAAPGSSCGLHQAPRHAAAASRRGVVVLASGGGGEASPEDPRAVLRISGGTDFRGLLVARKTGAPACACAAVPRRTCCVRAHD